MFNTIEEYTNAIKQELSDADPALVKDAQSDAREHLTMAVNAIQEKQPDLSHTDALKYAIDQYGTPEETAAAYREAERLTFPALNQTAKPRSILSRFLAYTPTRAHGERCSTC